MARYNSRLPEQILEPSLETLQMLTRAMQKDLDEAIYLTDLKTRLSALQSNVVTSAEQLLIKSSLATVIGRETMLSLSLEALRIDPNFNLTVSQEGVGEMIKGAIKSVIEKVKQFFAWLRGLFAKFFKNDKQKAEQYKSAESQADSISRSAEEAFANMKKNREAFEEAMKASDEAEAAMDEAMSKMKEQSENLKSKFSSDEEKDEFVKLLKLAKEKVVKVDRNGLTFVLKRSAMSPFRTKQDYSAGSMWIGNTLSNIPIAMGISLLSLIRSEAPSLDELKSDIAPLSNDKKMDRFFTETTDADGITFYSLRREKQEDLEINPRELRSYLQNSIHILKNNATAIEQLQKNEKGLVSALEGLNDSMDEDKLKGLKIWLKVNTSITRMLADTSTVARNIGDDCLRLVDSLK